MKSVIMLPLVLLFIGCSGSRSFKTSPTGQNIVLSSNQFDLIATAEKLLIGMTESEVVVVLGQPKEIKDNQWFYTYDFPDSIGQNRWKILMIEFKKHQVSGKAWLPKG